MTDDTYYNNDPRYELMATVIRDSNAFGGDCEMFLQDYLEILSLCYTFTVKDVWSARDLAEQIVSYLHGQWASTSSDFEEAARRFWTPSDTPSDSND